MHLRPIRFALFLTLLLAAALHGRASAVPQATGTANPPLFHVGASSTDTYIQYSNTQLTIFPVGKTLLLPIAVSGSGPITFSATSSSPSVVPMIKTGYPVMTITVNYSGTAAAVSGQTTAFATVYPFTGGNDGGNPQAGLISGTDGNFYGTTEADGSSGFGTVYQLTASGSLTTLHTFTGGADGGNPYAPLLSSGTIGNFFGTTETGGAGYGTVYEVNTSGSFATLYTFTGGADGGNPYGGVVTGTDGNFYGTATTGGAGFGTVYQLTASGSFSTLHTFTNGADGGTPRAGLTVGTDGNLYGTTITGGTGSGTIFEITTSGSLTTLYTFKGGNDGASPTGGVIEASDSQLYGTTEAGGTDGFGTVYQLTSSGSFNTLHAFTGGSDGGNPYAGVIQGLDGRLYGTAETGGTGYGAVYQVTTTGSFNTLYTFTGKNDGGNPYAPLLSSSGNLLYGAAATGGTDAHGVIYRVVATGSDAFTGAMKFALLRDMAPVTTGYIGGFAQAGYYNPKGSATLDFFRITNLSDTSEPGYIAQTGDPTNTGTGNPGFSFNNEFSPSLIFSGAGQLAMANSGIDQSTFLGTNGSQFFITQNNQVRYLDYGYTIFGQLIQGYDVMQKVMSVPLESNSSTPVGNVQIQSVTVTEDNTDALLLLSAPGAVSNGAVVKVSAADEFGTKAVVESGTTTTAGPLSINVSTFATDSINDPPFLQPVQNVEGALHQTVSVPIKAQDLEYDYLITGAQPITDPIDASINAIRNIATITPLSFEPVGTVTAGLYVYQPFTPVQRSDEYDQTAVTVGLGSGKLTAIPAVFTATPSSGLASSTSSLLAGTPTFGSFLDSNPAATASRFTATINWGDGVISGTSDVSVTKSSRVPTQFDITDNGNHYYAGAGIYTMNVTVTDTDGGVLEIQNTADVADGPIYAFGRTFTAAKGVANGEVATFVDRSSNVIAADYTATINWGDGSVSNGTIRGGNGSFAVYGAHKYAFGVTYPVDVTVNSAINSNSGYAWSTAKLTSVVTHQPPFAQSHIVGEIGNPGYGNGYLDEEVTLVNSGNIASGPVTLEFFLSPTPATDPIDGSAIQLQIGKGSTYQTLSVPAGSALTGSVSDIFVPSNVISAGKYIIMKVITSDPIGSHMKYPRAFADPNPLIE